MSTTPKTSLATRIITQVANKFPTIKLDPNQEFDIDAFMKPLPFLSKGEALARRFVANVWNPKAARTKWNFDLFEAMGCWDSEHRAAFTAWANEPRWP